MTISDGTRACCYSVLTDAGQAADITHPAHKNRSESCQQNVERTVVKRLKALRADLQEGAKAASSTCNLQHLGALTVSGATTHEVCQGDHGSALHGILPPNEQGLCGGLVHAGRLF